MVYLALFLLGLCFGSLVNAFVWRLHETANTKSLKRKKELSILHGRSMCVHCRHTLAWYDLVPVLSWLSLGGKCRYCKKPIHFQYPLVELITAVLFVLSYMYRPHSYGIYGFILFALWLILLVGFMALIVYDIRWMLLPNSIVFPLTGVAVFHTLVLAIDKQDLDVVIGAVMGLMSVGGLFYVLFQYSKGKWIGGGDVKLGFLLGLLAGGLLEGLMVVFVASLLGTLFALPAIALKKQTISNRIPFGPFLITSLIIVYLFGSMIMSLFEAQYILV